MLVEVITDVLAAGRTVHRIAAALVSGDQQLTVAVAVRIRVQEQATPIPSREPGDLSDEWLGMDAQTWPEPLGLGFAGRG
jgi:hypothetical protein